MHGIFLFESGYIKGTLSVGVPFLFAAYFRMFLVRKVVPMMGTFLFRRRIRKNARRWYGEKGMSK